MRCLLSLFSVVFTRPHQQSSQSIRRRLSKCSKPITKSLKPLSNLGKPSFVNQFFSILAKQRRQAPSGLRLPRAHPMPIIRMRSTRGRATSSDMQAADCPSLLRRALAAVACGLGSGAASGLIAKCLNCGCAFLAALVGPRYKPRKDRPAP